MNVIKVYYIVYQFLGRHRLLLCDMIVLSNISAREPRDNHRQRGKEFRKENEDDAHCGGSEYCTQVLSLCTNPDEIVDNTNTGEDDSTESTIHKLTK